MLSAAARFQLPKTGLSSQPVLIGVPACRADVQARQKYREPDRRRFRRGWRTSSTIAQLSSAEIAPLLAATKRGTTSMPCDSIHFSAAASAPSRSRASSASDGYCLSAKSHFAVAIRKTRLLRPPPSRPIAVTAAPASFRGNFGDSVKIIVLPGLGFNARRDCQRHAPRWWPRSQDSIGARGLSTQWPRTESAPVQPGIVGLPAPLRGRPRRSRIRRRQFLPAFRRASRQNGHLPGHPEAPSPKKPCWRIHCIAASRRLTRSGS